MNPNTINNQTNLRSTVIIIEQLRFVMKAECFIVFKISQT